MSRRELTFRFRPIWRVEPTDDLVARSRDLLRRIHSIWHKTQTAVYVFADADGSVYLVATENPYAERLARIERRYFVGSYGAHALFPTPDQLREDLIAHYFELDDLTQRLIREAG
jgi:hypothetical protein